MIKVDFHTHSNYSDGVYSPATLIEMAKENGLSYYALTDHDSVSGIEEARLKSESLNINFIPGIELSTENNDESVHLLGFFKDSSYQNIEFLKTLDTFKENRKERARQMILKLKKYYNIEIDYQSIASQNSDLIARPHIAKAIMKANYPYTFNQIFDRFIGKDCKAYVKAARISTKEGIDLLHKYNALVFIAHPVFVNKTKIESFIEMGIDGIECVYPKHSPKEQKNFAKIADKNNLLISAGSDFHGLENDIKHGPLGSMFLDDDHLNLLLKALKRLKA